MSSRSYPKVTVTQEMLARARELEPLVKVVRHRASVNDTLIGILGELAFAQYWLGQWEPHSRQIERNKGKVDFGRVEVKASALKFSEQRCLLVKQEYARARKPGFYVQVILDVRGANADTWSGIDAVICGWATSSEVDTAPLREFQTEDGSYFSHFILVSELHDTDSLRAAVDSPPEG
jgi:hypothetical protein